MNTTSNNGLNKNSMAGWSFSDNDIREAIHEGRLLNPSIDLSNPCNLNCPYCFIEEKNSERKLRFPNELSMEEILSTLRDFVSAGAKTINIVGSGEPTIDSRFEPVIKAISGFGVKPVVFTNGIRLSERPSIIDFLYDTDATIVIKYDSSKADLQDIVAGRKGYSVLRDQAVEALINRGFNSHVPTRMAFDIIAFRGNYSEILDIYDDCRRNNIFPIVTDFIPTGRTEYGEFLGQASIRTLPNKTREHITKLLQPLSQKERGSLYQILKQIDTDKYHLVHHQFPAYYNGSACTQSLGVYVDIHANIWPCVAKSMRENGQNVKGLLGNIRSGSKPSEVWRNHPYLNQIRDCYSGECPYKSKFVQASDDTTLNQKLHSNNYGGNFNVNSL